MHTNCSFTQITVFNFFLCCHHPERSVHFCTSCISLHQRNSSLHREGLSTQTFIIVFLPNSNCACALPKRRNGEARAAIPVKLTLIIHNMSIIPLTIL